MKTLITLALVAGLAPFVSASDGNSASATAQVSVTILAPVKVTATGTLDFGKVVVSNFPTDIKISGSAQVTCDANATRFVNPGATGVPKFTITKDTSASVNVAFAPQFNNNVVFTVDPSVVTGANAFATSSLASYNDKPLFGMLTLPVGTQTGLIQGSITITANYI